MARHGRAEIFALPPASLSAPQLPDCPKPAALFVVLKKENMNTEDRFFHLSEWASWRRKREPKPVSGAAAGLESIVWIVSFVLMILGLLHAAQTEQPLLWIAVWPAPVALACTILMFVRKGFHFEDGVLVLGQTGSSPRLSDSN
jgi:hypothetical protein